MKKLDVSSVTDSARFPIKSGTLAFLQQAYGEALEGIIISLIGPTYSTATMYVLSGCVNTGSGSNYTISGGYVFFNGEIYSVPSAGFSTTGTDVPVFVLLSTFVMAINADPVTFTDNSTKNVHNVRQVAVQSGVTGSGLSDYSTRFVMNFTIPAQLNATGSGVSGTYPNLVFAGPGLQPLAVGRVHYGDVPGGSSTLAVTFTTPLTTTSYIVIPSVISIGTTPSNDIYVHVGVIDSTRTVNGFTFEVREHNSETQNIDIAYVVYPV